MILINKTLHQQNHFRGILKQIPWKKTYLYAAMEKIDEDIEELEIRSVRDEEAHVKQERLIVLPEVLPHDSRVRSIMPA